MIVGRTRRDSSSKPDQRRKMTTSSSTGISCSDGVTNLVQVFSPLGTCKRWIRVLVVASLLLGLADARRPMQRAVLPSEERFVADPVSVGVTSFRVNASKVVSPWDHYWERCVGSGHAALALRADYQDQMRQTRNDLGFQQVRFHGLFVDDMSVALPAEDGKYNPLLASPPNSNLSPLPS